MSEVFLIIAALILLAGLSAFGIHVYTYIKITREFRRRFPESPLPPPL